MCRISGIIGSGVSKAIVQAMNTTLSHGGPDDQGVYQSEQVALAHRRLSILDLSVAGHQPMRWQNYVIVYNGEIYNFKEIQKELSVHGHRFESGSDTEVILKAYQQWGKDCVGRFRGMFAFALWDEQLKKLLLCRDRVGVKPLYWYQKDGLFMFASELKAFHEHPDFDKSIDHDAVSLFLQQEYIPSPYSIFKHVRKVMPGTFLEIDENGNIQETVYWDAEEIYKNVNINRQKEQGVKEELRGILKESFSLRMVADVPVGMFLSGGVDSSLVSALIQEQTNRQVKTFTIGFDDPAYNEAKYAKEVATHLGTDHTELYCTEQMFKDLLPKLPDFYDEPFGAESAIPTYIVSTLAKKDVKVCLSADGGDELFGGYTKYEYGLKFHHQINKIPRSFRSLGAKAISLVDANWLEENKAVIPILKNYSNLGSKIPKFQNALKANDLKEFFDLSSTFISPTQLGELIPKIKTRFKTDLLPKEDLLLSYMGVLDIKTYLEGEVMTKVDRATMQTALEGREPMLDHHIIEYALGIPDNLKQKNGVSKYILRSILYDYVPKQLIERPKQGFSVPINNWLKSFMLTDVENMVNDHGFVETFRFNQANLNSLVDRFMDNQKGVKPTPHFIWLLVVLHKWYKRWICP